VSSVTAQLPREPAFSKRKPRLSPFKLLLLALGAGITCGLFFGEYCQALKFIGRAYVGLLQMTVLPFIVFSLIANIGRLSLVESKRLAISGMAVLAVLFTVGAATVMVMPLALPAWKTGSFFSTSLLEPPEKVNFLELFIPSNPFYSLAENLTPAVVLFCLFCGFALSNVKKQEPLLDLLSTINATLSKVSTYVVRLSPIGIFAISASASGTLTLEEFGRLQAYLFIYIGAALLLTLWVLPMLICAFTPFRYRDILRASADALLTAFVVGSVFVVIPMLVESIRNLLEQYQEEGIQLGGSQTSTHPDFIIPLAYPFPHLGKIVTLLFVPFAAWFYGQPMSLFDYPLFLVVGLFLSFGKVTTTIPFLLEMERVPADIFQLFLMSGVVAGRFNDLLGAMHLLAFTVLTICAMGGLLRFSHLRLLWGGVVTVLIGGVIVTTTQLALNVMVKEAFSRDKVIAEMHLMQQHVPSKILSYGEPNPRLYPAGEGQLGRILASGKIRIGFHPDNLPFSYYNAQRELVGFDIDMAHRLARELKVEIEFVPFAFATLADQLEDDHFDIAMSGIGLTLEGKRALLFSNPYLNVTLAFVVRDHDRGEFADVNRIFALKSVKLGVAIDSFFSAAVREYLPWAEVVELWSESQFFQGPPQYMDGLVTSAEGGSAWTLLYPEYDVINPLGNIVSVPLVYPMAGNDRQLEELMDNWIEIKKSDGTIEGLYDYWILGRGARIKTPRWSVIRDVLQWVD
jgi:Na+/H+-dicarboxylate symporter/ABC-type amino acid transport substrate-binding protein